MISACHHVAVCVSDVEAARNFYAGALGLDELPRPSDIDIPGVWYRLGASELHVFYSEGYRPPRSASFPPHLALRSEDFDAAVARIEDAGVTLDYGPSRGEDGIRRAVMRDPTGNVVEITDAPLLETSRR